MTWAQLGAPLVVRLGDAVEILSRLASRHRIGRIVSHEETGNLWILCPRGPSRGRLGARCRASSGRNCRSRGVIRRLRTRDGWAASARCASCRCRCCPPGSAGPGAGGRAWPIPQRPRPAPGRRPLRAPPAGRAGAGAVACSTASCDRRGETYRVGDVVARHRERACSRLSPHLALGTLSSRESCTAGQAPAGHRPGGGWGGSLTSFQSRLRLARPLHAETRGSPSIETHCLHPATEALRPRTPIPRGWRPGTDR